MNKPLAFNPGVPSLIPGSSGLSGVTLWHSSFELLIILSLLLIQSEDIELKPGPNLLERESDSITMDDVSISKYFSIVHYNIQSVTNKIDLIGAELSNCSVIC